MTITNASVEGIHNAEALLDQTATRIAKQTDSSEQGPDVVSLSDEAVALIEAEISVAANVAAFHASSGIQKALVDLLG
jgi:hypothetical protein